LIRTPWSRQPQDLVSRGLAAISPVTALRATRMWREETSHDALPDLCTLHGNVSEVYVQIAPVASPCPRPEFPKRRRARLRASLPLIPSDRTKPAALLRGTTFEPTGSSDRFTLSQRTSEARKAPPLLPAAPTHDSIRES
jgi:hypothetical protein